MTQGIQLKDLVSKFNQGRITEDGLGELLSHTSHDCPDTGMNELYESAWKESEGAPQCEFTESAYTSILQKTGIATFAKRSNHRGLWPVMRYAAIFVLAFFMSWAVHTWLNKKNINGQNIVFQKVEVSYGSKTRLQLPDGTRVVLNSGSTLSYPGIFENGSRTVYLTGEAFFDVKKDKTNPFYVNTSGIRVKVLGTTFNVKAYPEESMVVTTLVTGEVQIFTGNQTKVPDITLKPSEKAVYNKENKQLHRIDENAPDKMTSTSAVLPENSQNTMVQTNAKINVAIAWKDNQLVFDNEEFNELAAKIERWFNVELNLDYPALKNARFSGKFDKETIEQALNAMTLATPFRYRIIKNKITIYK